MPIYADIDRSPKRRATVWAVTLALAVVLLPVGAFGWSWDHPVAVQFGGRGVGFGYGYRAMEAEAFPESNTPGVEAIHHLWLLKPPPGLGEDYYRVWWY